MSPHLPRVVRDIPILTNQRDCNRKGDEGALGSLVPPFISGSTSRAVDDFRDLHAVVPFDDDELPSGHYFAVDRELDWVICHLAYGEHRFHIEVDRIFKGDFRTTDNYGYSDFDIAEAGEG